MRPPRQEAYLSLAFEPGECAQVDWGCAGTLAVGNTNRRLSFFAMVLCYSRKLCVEFTLLERQEQFLACHHNAFVNFGGVSRRVMVDNLKSAVLSHPAGQPAVYHSRYLPIDKLGDDLLFHVFSERYERGPVIITTNKAYKHWHSIFNNDASLTSAVLDRLLHHAETLLIEGPSYRMKDRIADI